MTSDEWKTDVARVWRKVYGGARCDASTFEFAAEIAEMAKAAERERCAQYLRDAAERLAPEGKRTNQVDRHTAHVLATKGDELAHGCHVRA